MGAAIGAIAGGIGYGAALAVQRYWRLRALPYSIVVAAALLGIGGGTALIDRLPFGGRGEVVAVDDALPYMQLIKAREPGLYERIETSVIRDQEEGMSPERVRANAASLVMSFVSDKSVFLSDDLTYDLAATTRDQLAYLGDRGDHQTCSEVALGRAKGDLDARLSADLVERGFSNTARVLAAPTNQDAPRMPAEEFRQLATRAFADASQKSGVPPEDVDNILAGSGDAVKTCKLMKAFYDALLAQPVEVAASALRTMTSGERTVSP